MSDIRKWFMKKHDKGNGNASNKAKLDIPAKPTPPAPKPQPVESNAQDGSRRTKTSKYFATSASEPVKEKTTLSKRKLHKDDEAIDSDSKCPSAKKLHKDEDEDDDVDFVMPSPKKRCPEAKTAKKLKNEPAKDSMDIDDNDEEDVTDNMVSSTVKPGGRGRGRGRGGRGPSGAPAAGRGRGGGRGGFMNFGERKDPPHKGEKEVPEGTADCLSGLTFVISGTLDSLEREEAEDLIKRHGGRVTGSVSRKTNFLLADEDVGGRKSQKAKELGVSFLTEDGLFDMIRKSKPVKAHIAGVPDQSNSVLKSSPVKIDGKDVPVSSVSASRDSAKEKLMGVSASKRKDEINGIISKTWTEKYKPKVTSDIIGNQSLVKQLHDWLAHWNEQFLHTVPKGKGKRESDNTVKKAALMSGPPGIGKTTTAKLVSQMLGFQAIEVNASDSRGKADSKIIKGIGGSTSNSIKELVSNQALDPSKDWSTRPKTVLVMDEVDGMSAGDRGGIADLIASIKISKVPIICICNDRYSQKLKSLINYCQLLNYRKPTKQQIGKRLMQIANAEGIQVNEIAMEELADRVNGDIRMAINQLQYMGLTKSAIKYDDIRARLLNSAKDEDISPFTAVDKLFGYNSGRLRMDERVDLCMSDPDLIPLIIQENYLNYKPVSVGMDDNGTRRMKLIARAAESICDGDMANVQIRRYRQWQLSQASSLVSCIIPASLLHGNREILEQGERNFNRFGGWLGKNSTMGKNLRLLQDLHVHVLSSLESNLDRDIVRIDYFSLLLKQLTDPLRTQPKEAAVQNVVQFMDEYSLRQEDFDTIVELSKFHGHSNPLDSVQPAVKAALTKAYKQASSSRLVRAGAADLINLPGLKKAPKKRIAAILEPVESNNPEENGDSLLENEEEASDTEDNDGVNGETNLKLDLQSNKAKGIQVQLELKNSESSSVKKTPAGRSRGSGPVEKGGRGSGSRGSGPAGKRGRGSNSSAKAKR